MQIVSNLFSIPWTHIYLDDSKIESEKLQEIYTLISQIYQENKFKTYIRALKLNQSYSLLRDLKQSFCPETPSYFQETYKEKISKFLSENNPALSIGVPENFSSNTLVL